MKFLSTAAVPDLTGAPGACSRDAKSCSRAPRAVIDAVSSRDGNQIFSNAAVPDLHRSNWRMLA
jgi:hypothetical protein